MKKQISIIVMIIISTLLILNIPVINADPAVIVSSYSLNPEVLLPGDSGILTLTILNNEATSTKTTTSTSTSGSSSTTVKTIGDVIDNIWVEADSDSNGKKVKASLNYPEVGYLPAGSSFNIDFEIIAEENITTGWYFPIVHIDVEDEDYQDSSYPVPIFVSNISIDLIATDIPNKISRSGSTGIILSVANKQGGTFEGVTVQPYAESGANFVPDSIFIGSLESGASEDASFSVKSSSLGKKNFSFKVSFYNGKNLHNIYLNKSIEIIETLDVAPIFTSIFSSITKGSTARISLEVYNAKNEEITGVIVKPIGDGTFVPTQYFIGSMDPDDVFSATFDFYTNTLDYGNYTMGFKVIFKQDNEHYETPITSSSFSVIPGEVTSYIGNNDQSSDSSEFSQVPPLSVCVGTIIVIIVLIALAIILFKLWKKRRNA